MADEKKSVKENKEAAKKPNKFIAFFKNLPQNIATPFKNMWHEMKKVTWPTKQDLIKYTGIVLLFMAFMGIVIGLLDMGSSALVSAVSSINKTEEEQIIIDSSDAAETVDDAVSETADEAADAAKEATEAAEAAAEETAEAVEAAAEETAEAVEAAAEETAEAAKDAAEGAAEAVEETAKEATEAVEEAVEAPAEGN